jgi:hypothetical protein
VAAVGLLSAVRDLGFMPLNNTDQRSVKRRTR